MASLPEKGQSLPDVEFATEDGGKLAASELGGQKPFCISIRRTTRRDARRRRALSGIRCPTTKPNYEAAGMKVYGVSLDSPESHRKFREKHGLTFPLLTDEDGKASEAFGILGEKGRAKRVTFLLDEEAKVEKVYPEVSPETHAGGILADAANM